MNGRPTAAELLDTPGGVLSRTDLRYLGWERRAVDAIFRELDVIFLPGYSRGVVRREDYLDLLERSTYRGDRVRPTGSIHCAGVQKERPDRTAQTAPAGTRPRPSRRS